MHFLKQLRCKCGWRHYLQKMIFLGNLYLLCQLFLFHSPKPQFTTLSYILEILKSGKLDLLFSLVSVFPGVFSAIKPSAQQCFKKLAITNDWWVRIIIWSHGFCKKQLSWSPRFMFMAKWVYLIVFFFLTKSKGITISFLWSKVSSNVSFHLKLVQHSRIISTTLWISLWASTMYMFCYISRFGIS